MKVFNGIAELAGAAGLKLGSSDWLTVEQSRVALFADATDDHQWIHLDAERAAAGPYGATIAHGFLTLSLLPMFAKQIYRIEGVRMVVNYGLNKVRFPAPVRVGARIRATSELVEVTELEGAVQLVVSTVVEAEGSEKPVCVAESVVRAYA